MKLIKTKNYQEMSRTAANIVSAQIILFPKSVIGLATGSTPIGMYRQLAEWNYKGDLDFSKVKTFNLDEYIGLPKDHDTSYFWFMRHNFFNHINIDLINTYLPDGLAEDVEKECQNYEENIRNSGGIDLQVLGLGHNGHIGFNEPDSVFKKNTHIAVLTERTISANARFFENPEQMPKTAITMGMGTIMQAKRIIMMCSGEEKSPTLRSALLGDIDPLLPASILQLHTNVTVVADEAALRFIDLDELSANGIEVHDEFQKGL